MRFQSGVLAATEAMVGLAYDADDTNLYRLEFVGHSEFLDIEKEGISENIVQPVRDLFDFLTLLLTYTFLKWQLVVGKKYEVVVTNKDGLWRYQLNDIVEVAGFTPEEGIPLLRFIERKGCVEESSRRSFLVCIANTDLEWHSASVANFSLNPSFEKSSVH